MKEFAALLVLSAPILAVLCIGGFAAFAGWVAARRVKETNKKWIASGVVTLAVILVFVWDEIAGRMYLRYLCATEGGAKVFKRVSLSSDYWRSSGTPIFMDESGNKIASRLDDYYQFDSTSDEHYSKLFRIRQYLNLVQDRQNAKTVGTYTHFAFYGGWFVNSISLDVAGTGCPSETNFYSKFLSAIFIQSR